MNRYIAVSLVLGAAIAYGAFKVSPFLALLLLPPFAWFCARALVHGGFDFWHWARQGSKREWNGRYYEFGGVHLRVQELEDGLAFVESDLLKVIEQPASKTVELFGPDERVRVGESEVTLLTQAGCERLLTKCPHRDAKKLMLFLQREAFLPYDRRQST